MWALFFSPTIRWLNYSLGIPATIVGYADDLAATAKDVFDLFRRLLEFFDHLLVVAGLELNHGKIVVVPLIAFDPVVFRQKLAAVDSRLAAVVIASCGKHLGTMVGPGAA